MAAPISVLLIDDNSVFLRILKRFLEEHSGGEVVVVGSVNGGERALTTASALKPQVILVDLAMPDMHGLDLIPPLRASLPGAIIIVLTLTDPDSYCSAVLAAGADAFVSKTFLEEELLPTMRRLSQVKRSQGNCADCGVS